MNNVVDVNVAEMVKQNVEAVAASGFGITLCLINHAVAIATANDIMNDVSSPFHAEQISVEGRSVHIRPADPNAQMVEKKAELFCQEFSKQFNIPVVSWVETVRWAM